MLGFGICFPRFPLQTTFESVRKQPAICHIVREVLSKVRRFWQSTVCRLSHCGYRILSGDLVFLPLDVPLVAFLLFFPIRYLLAHICAFTCFYSNSFFLFVQYLFFKQALVSVTSLLLSYLLHFYQVLIVFPSVFVVEISVLVEIILLKRRRVKNEKIKENGKENC